MQKAAVDNAGSLVIIGVNHTTDQADLVPVFVDRAVQLYGYVIASCPGRRSNPRVAGGRLLRPLHFLAMTRPESLELNSPAFVDEFGTTFSIG